MVCNSFFLLLRKIERPPSLPLPGPRALADVSDILDSNTVLRDVGKVMLQQYVTRNLEP